MGAVSFSQIASTGNYVPLLSIEMDPSQAGTDTQVLTGLITGYMNSGLATPGTKVTVGRQSQAVALFGAGSMLERMCARWFALNQDTPLTVLPVEQPAAGATATGTITVSSAPTQAGTLTLYIAGYPVPVAVGASDTTTDVATACADAINANASVPVTAVAAAAVVTLTCDFKGVLGNDIYLTANYRGVNGGEVMPAGLAVTFANNNFMTGGSGVPDWTAAIAALGDNPYEFVAMPFNDTGSLSAWGLEYGFSATGRWGVNRQTYGGIYSAIRGTYSDHMAFGPNQNYPTITIMAMEKKVPAPCWEVAAAYAGRAALALSADPARPLQTLTLDGILPALPQDLFAKLELKSIAGVGLAIQGTVAGTMQILREQTTYQFNSYGQADNSYQLVTTLSTLATINRRLQTAITNKFPRSKLANDGTNFGAGQAIVTPNAFKAELVAQYRQMEFDGLVENTDLFKKNLIVARSSTDPDRIDVLLPPDIINGFRFGAILNQFRLNYPDPALTRA
jgi:phage tail sheath gpL-like